MSDKLMQNEENGSSVVHFNHDIKCHYRNDLAFAIIIFLCNLILF